MDKTSMILGWLTGRMIARQRKAVGKQPVAYLKNGVLYIEDAQATLNGNILEVK